MSVNFNNILDFQKFCLSNEKLAILPGDQLKIQTLRPLSLIGSSNELEMPELPLSDKTADLVNYLNKLIAPVGLSVSINGFGIVNCDISDALEATFSEGAILTVRKAEHIFARASQLFSLMVATGHTTLTLAANQQMSFIGLNSNRFNNLDKLTVLDQVFSHSCPSGYQLRMNAENLHIKTEQNFRHNGRDQYACHLASTSSPTTFSITETPHPTSYSPMDFVERMLIGNRLHIPADKTLVIEGPEIKDLYKRWELYWSSSEVQTDLFILNQLFLPFNLSVSINAHNETYHYKIENQKLVLYGSALTLSLLDIPYSYVDLKELGWEMPHLARTSVSFPPNQTIIFSGVTQKEEMEIEVWTNSKSLKDRIEGIKSFFRSRNPIGFLWRFQIPSSLYAETTCQDNQRWLLLEGDQFPIKLSLIPIGDDDGALFALSIIEHSSTSLAEGIQNGDIPAILQLLFQSIFFFCYQKFDRFVNPTVPNFFKQETQKAIQQAINDPIFLDHAEQISLNQELNESLSEIIEATPEEFDRMGTSPNESIAFIVNRIRQIASGELQGSKYTQDAISAVANYLNSNNQS